MNRRSRGRVVVWCCIAAAELPFPTTASSQPLAVRQEAVSVPADGAATRRLLTVLELAAAGDRERTAAALDDLETASGDALIEVQPRRFLRAGRVVGILRSQLDLVLPDTRLRPDDIRAATLLEQARQLEDEPLLSSIWTRFSGTPAAGQAVNAQAELCWRDDRLDAAAALWRLLRPRGVAPAVDPAEPLRIAADDLTAAEIAARLALVELYCGDTVRARQLTRRFAMEFPSAEGYLSGRRGPLLDALTAALEAEAAGPSAGGAQPALAGAPVWRVPLDASFTAGRWFNRPLLSPATPPPVVPVAGREGLFWSLRTGIHGLRTDNGESLWAGPEAPHDSLVCGEAAASGYSFTQRYVGELLYGVALDADRLYAVLGAPFVNASATEPRPAEQNLICLDVGSQEGKLLWSCAPHECCPDATWRFSGPPVGVGRLVLVPARRGLPNVEIGVVCLREHDGARLWFQTVAGLLSQPPRAMHVVTADWLSTAYGRAYLSGDWGGTACLTADGGQIEWIRGDAPLPWTTPPLVPTGEIAGRGAVCHRGVVYAVEQDDRTVVALDALTGALHWRQSLPGRIRQVVGVRAGVLVTTGQQVWGLDIDDGTIAWRSGFDDVEGAVAGQAQISGTTVLFCTADELWQVDLPTGQPVRRVPLWDAYGVRGGHVVAAAERIVIASAGGLAALRMLGDGTP